MSVSKYAGALLVSACLFGASGAALAEEATPQEVIQKTNQAAQLLEQQGEEALAQFRERDSEYVWKDTYVFVVDCNQNAIVAHPVNQQLEGQDLSNLQDKAGRTFGPDLCQDVQAAGHWIEYSWPKAGEEEASRKLTYMQPVEGTNLRAAAGVYDETATLAELEQMSTQQ